MNMTGRLKTDCPYRQQAVRDLAFLLCAPSPWTTTASLPPGSLLGPDGLERLSRLDAVPAALNDWIARHAVQRLGRYAELLLAFWFDHVPHIERCATNLLLRDGNRVVGEFDFLLRINGAPWHLETASKFYLQLGTATDSLVGPDGLERWSDKAHRLERQLQLSHHPAAASVLPAGFAACQPGVLLSGWLFLPVDQVPPSPFSRGTCCGWLAGVEESWPQLQTDSRWCCLPRLRWLSPACAPESDTESLGGLKTRLRALEAPQMVVELQRCDAGWVEVARGMVLSPHWREKVLAAAQERGRP